MVNYEILYGLRAGLERRQPLQSAMMSFYNAGYDKAEIEEAAKALVEEIQGIELPKVDYPERPSQFSKFKVYSEKKETAESPKTARVPFAPLTLLKSPPPVSTTPVTPAQAPANKTPSKENIPAPAPAQSKEIAKEIAEELSKIQSKPIKPGIYVPQVQKVSGYGEGKSAAGNKLIIIILVILLLFLSAVLVGIFMFKDQIIALLNSLF